MADQLLVDAIVKAMGDVPWDQTDIAERLDAGQTSNVILSAFWDAVSADTYQLANVTEGGSSRSLSDIHKNAAAMAAMYAKRVDSETVVVDSEARGTYFHIVTRV